MIHFPSLALYFPLCAMEKEVLALALKTEKHIEPAWEGHEPMKLHITEAVGVMLVFF